MSEGVLGEEEEEGGIMLWVGEMGVVACDKGECWGGGGRGDGGGGGD